jgi:hypothetical protein
MNGMTSFNSQHGNCIISLHQLFKCISGTHLIFYVVGIMKTYGNKLNFSTRKIGQILHVYKTDLLGSCFYTSFGETKDSVLKIHQHFLY